VREVDHTYAINTIHQKYSEVCLFGLQIVGELRVEEAGVNGRYNAAQRNAYVQRHSDLIPCLTVPYLKPVGE